LKVERSACPYWPQPEAEMVVRASRPRWSSQTDDLQLKRLSEIVVVRAGRLRWLLRPD
jgi:hypothetical protein